MSTAQYQLFHERIGQAINQCIDACSIGTKPVSEINNATIEDLVRSTIGPLASAENILNINLMDDKPDWRKHGTELAFRRVLFDLVSRLPETNPEHFQRLFNGLDIVLATIDLGFLEPVVCLTLLEELLDVHTIYGCEQLFDYIEKRKSRLTVNMIPGRGKGLVLLRMCNEMLRRLSKEKNTVFCGRILMFLANSFPLGERSGVNLRGEFNTETVLYDKDEDVDADPNMTEEQKTFYKLFWSTRKYFSNPPIIFQNNGFNELIKGGDAILDRFKQISNNEEAVSGSGGSNSSNERTGAKRKRGDAMDIDEDEANNDTVKQMLDEINREYQFPRLLSSRKLLELEIEDTRFRRNVIVQFLILFQYLNGFTQEEKEETQKLLNSRGATKQSLVLPNFTLEGDELEWVQNTEKSMLELLKVTKPHGELYTDIVQTVLRHERNWIIWKASGCPAFEKPPITLPEDINQTRQDKRNRLAKSFLTTYRFAYGNPETTKMYGGQEQQKLIDAMQSRPKLPESVEIIDAALSKIEQQKQNLSVIERYDIANGAIFQTTRLLFNSQAALIPKMYNIKKEVYRSFKEPPKKEEGEEKEKEGSQTTSTTTGKIAVSVDEKDERHLEAEIDVLKKTRDLITDTSN